MDWRTNLLITFFILLLPYKREARLSPYCWKGQISDIVNKLVNFR